MANIKSAKKRILVTETKARNKAIKSKVKTAVKKVETAVAEKNVEAAKAVFTQQSLRFPKLEARVFNTRKQFPERSLVFPKLLTLSLNYK